GGAAARAERIPLLAVGHPGGTGQALRAHQRGPDARRRDRRSGSFAGGGRRPQPAPPRRQGRMIRINLAPERPRQGAGPTLAMPSFNMGFAIVVIYVVTVVGIGGGWVRLPPPQTRLHNTAGPRPHTTSPPHGRGGAQSQST